MGFPAYVHCVVASDAPEAWPIQAQGQNECGCTSPANAINLLLGEQRFTKDQFIREAGWLFYAPLGGSPSFVTGWLLRRHGFGTHFGSLAYTDGALVLRDLIDRRVPVVIELWSNKIGPFTLYGQHSVVLVGYSDPYVDANGEQHEEYYVVDSQYPALGQLDLAANDVDRDGDGVAERFPGNRTFSSDEFWKIFLTGIYFPVFPSQADHDAWYVATMAALPRLPLLGPLLSSLATGRLDQRRE